MSLLYGEKASSVCPPSTRRVVQGGATRRKSHRHQALPQFLPRRGALPLQLFLVPPAHGPAYCIPQPPRVRETGGPDSARECA